MVKTSPKEIRGQWDAGYALDFHTVSSDFIGYDEYGHPKFDTKYTEVGELLYRLKSKKDKSVVEDIVKVVADFVWTKRWSIDLIISVPPSSARSFQPVIVLAKSLAEVLEVKYCSDCVKKIKDTPQLKNVFDAQERRKLLIGSFQSDRSKVQGKRVRLFDDLYRSGATMNEVASSLQKAGARNIYTLALTMTRVHR